MTSFHRFLVFLAAACLFSTGCVESSREEVTGKSSVRAVNAVTESPDISFRIEERSIGSVPFGSVSAAQRYDDLSYNFNFDLTVPGESEPRRLVSHFVDVEADRSYMFVFTGSIADPELVAWDDAERTWEGDETVFEMGFAHFNEAIGEVDVFFGPPGTAPAAGNQVATLSQNERSVPAEFVEGQYVVTLTPAGDPSTLLYTSRTRTYSPATTDMIMIFNGDPSRSEEIGVRLISGAGTATALQDPRIPPTGRFLHAAFGAGNVDVAEDGDFSRPVVSNQAFGELSGDVALTAGAHDYTWTAAGNQGAILIETEQTIPDGLRSALTFVGSNGEFDVLNVASTRRPFATSGRLGFTNAAAAFDTVDIYLLRGDATLEDSNPSSPAIPFKFNTGMGSVAAGSYSVTVTAAGEKTALAGPLALEVANRDVYSIFVLDTADPNALEIRVVRNAP